MKINEIILQSVSKVVVFIILTLALYLFFSGHHAPGGGFIAGLVLGSAFVLILLAYDIETLQEGIPVDFKMVATIGAFIVVISGISSVIFGHTFLYQSLFLIEVPIYGLIQLSSVTFFELGVALTVLGVVVTIILNIGEDVS